MNMHAIARRFRLVQVLILLSFCFLNPSVGFAQAPLEPLKLIQVAPNVFYVQGLAELGSSQNQNFISNAGFVVTPQGVVVIDALGSPMLAQRLITSIRAITSKPIIALVLTHYHADHIYGAQAFKALGATIYAQAAGKNYLNSDAAIQRLQSSRIDFAPWVNAETKLMPADIWIQGDLKLDLGGYPVQLLHAGPAHSPEDLMVYLPISGVLFSGDILFQGRIPFVGNADSKGWLHSLERIESLKPKMIVPGHGSFSNQPEKAVVFTRDYLRYLRETMGPAALNLESFDEAYRATNWSEYEGYPLFKAANRMNAYNTYLLIQSE